MAEIIENSKSSKFEQIINAGIDTDVDSGFGGALDQIKVSEKIRENAGENITGTTSGTQDDSFGGLAIVSAKIGSVLPQSGTKKVKKLPTPKVQKKEIEQVLVRRTQKLVRKATKMQNSRTFSAHKLEEVLREIRHLRSLLAGLWSSTVGQVEHLYRRFVWKEV